MIGKLGGLVQGHTFGTNGRKHFDPDNPGLPAIGVDVFMIGTHDERNDGNAGA